VSNGISGRGRKRPLVDVPVERLELDPKNPRLPMDLREKEQSEILAIFKRYFDLDELAYSMAENGYFDEEPLVAVPIILPTKFADRDSLNLINDGEYINFITNEARFTVIEGNRRLATVKLLLSDELQARLRIRGWPRISEAVRQDLSILPVIVYSDRAEVLSYMGVRHITGIKKWESFSKALYIAEMIDGNIEISEIQKRVGDQTGSVRKLYLAYKLVEIAESELSLATGRAKEYFSYLILALGQRSVKDFLGLPNKWTEINFEEPIPSDHMDNLAYLFSWLFGENKDKPQVVKESRDITNYLSPILRSEEATKHLILTRDLQDAWDRSGGEKLLLLKNLRKAVKSLSNSLALITNYKTDDEVRQEIKYCQDILDDILKLIQE
jgi:hypothetical protein